MATFLTEAKAKQSRSVSGGCNGFSIMKVLVQHPGAHCWLCADDSWTNDVQEARDFHSVTDAVIYCIKQNISFQIVLAFDDSRYDLTLIDEVKSPGNVLAPVVIPLKSPR